MDHEYLQNMMGSPYVNEGAFGQLKAKAAQAMGAAGTMAGHQIQSPNETKLHSLWEGFMTSLKKAMKDWAGQVAPMFDEQVPLNEKQQQVKESLDALARLLSSVGPQKVGEFPRGDHDPKVRNQRDNPETYVKGSAYNRSTTSPPKKPKGFEVGPMHGFNGLGGYNPKTPTKLTELIDEGFWDAAKRDVGLNKSLGSNDPSTILDSYKNHVLSLFTGFMKDAVKMTKMTAQQVYSVLAKMQPAQQGWQAAGNMQKVVQQLKTLQSIGDIKGAGAPPVMNPQAAAGAVPPVIPTAQPPQQPPAAAAAQPAGQTPSNGTTPPSGGGAGVAGGSGEVSPKDLPVIILKAMKIIIDAVKSDIGHSGKYFDVSELPKDFGGPSLTKETVAPPKPKGGNTGNEPEDTPEVPGEFLYNFHSAHRKTPAASFSIQVKPVHEKPEIEGTPYKVEVFWQNESHKNKIWCIAENQGKKSKPILIMQFFDNEVSSESGATTQGDTNFFSIEKILNAATPNADPNTQGALSQADGNVKAQIKQLENPLLRALMATTGRKTMEWKVKSKKVFPLTYDAAGNVTYTDAEGVKKTISKEAVKDLLNNKDYATSETWKESLDHYDYFKYHEGTKPPDISDFPAFQESVTKMMQNGISEPEANKLVATAWMSLTKEKPKDKITGDELYDVAMGTKSSANPKAQFQEEMQKYPALKDAFLALKTLNWASKDIPIPLEAAWKTLKATKVPDTITREELITLVLKKGPATPATPPAAAPAAPAKTPPSKPAGQPAPTSPVSAPVSGPAPTTDPTAPVSTDKPEPDKGQQPTGQGKVTSPEKGQGQEPKQPNQQKKAAEQPIEIWKGENGQMQWKNKAGKIGGLSSKTIAKLTQEDPKFLQALKTAKEKGFKSPYTDLKERVINPFQRDNFLL
jgi:hypothetical protein